MTDAEITTLRQRIEASHQLTPGDLLAWDLVIVFGLRPVELQGLELQQQDGAIVATVTRNKRSSRATSGARTIPAVPPADWPADCYGLLERWRRHGLPLSLLRHRSPGQVMAQQIRRLHMPEGLGSYAPRHAFAIRLAEIGLNYREAATLMGHSPQVHCAVYGRRLDEPGLMAKVARLTADSNRQQMD